MTYQVIHGQAHCWCVVDEQGHIVHSGLCSKQVAEAIAVSDADSDKQIEKIESLRKA